MFGLFKSGEKFKTISPAQLADLQREAGAGVVLVDVREDNEWAGGHIPGAVHAPLSRFAEAAKQLPKDKPVIFYCQGGVRSKKALGLATSCGLLADTDLAGGIAAWRSQGRPVER